MTFIINKSLIIQILSLIIYYLTLFVIFTVKQLAILSSFCAQILCLLPVFIIIFLFCQTEFGKRKKRHRKMLSILTSLLSVSATYVCMRTHTQIEYVCVCATVRCCFAYKIRRNVRSPKMSINFLNVLRTCIYICSAPALPLFSSLTLSPVCVCVYRDMHALKSNWC